MPIYAYQCAACGAEHEALQKISDAPLTVCPACQQPALAKKVTAAGFQLKGSGWYVTDFRDKGTAKKPDAKADAAKSDAGKDAKEGASSDSGKGATTTGKSDAAAPSPAPAAAPPPASPPPSTSSGS